MFLKLFLASEYIIDYLHNNYFCFLITAQMFQIAVFITPQTVTRENGDYNMF